MPSAPAASPGRDLVEIERAAV
uniref:Uncharacterized protein n=1 Tax=Arundo donax TaxID=35708 RepID=A0A0A9AFE3_ARUDO